MQAHFKSYTCTQCHQEISNNETLRSHMFRSHSISRMFMCRCCNWCFPDKTSLHIHMQSMNKFGTPGEVAVLAKSSSHDPDDHSSQASGAYSPHTSKHLLPQAKSLPSSIFPTLFSQDNLFKNKLPKSQTDLTSPQNWLNHWLRNNPLTNIGLPNINSLGCGINTKMEQQNEIDESDYDELEVTTTEEDLKQEEEQARQGEQSEEVDQKSVIVKLESSPLKRKSDDRSHDEESGEQLDIEKDDDEPKLKIALIDKPNPEQPSPTASDSHISDSHTSNSSNAPDSPPTKCFDCQVAKGKLSQSERKIEEYENKIRELHQAIEAMKRLQPTNNISLPNMPKLGPMPAAPTPAPAFANFVVPPPTSSSIFMPNAFPQNIVQNNAFKMLFNNFMQSQLNLNKKQC
ncbi:hypothetical protein WR25_05131 [Diploscapter pachys]|uniref:C2H2-type domain-containing protein n=1 Tax=Diploscapter pachys TaxID=2018661 RepID=A0A2A2JHZ4_9BILA|nr:hypothetical protein WR25_05131 [Diploscapter pachys]